ncbi:MULTISPECIES: hypothetical protein [unclassified Sphingomonas]|uniref:hypothetical protein n=1 Tax=unclassified Sphingomonas TaxID=196159 RepID=UPI0006F80B36|nr:MULTISPECIES: hypothetical protein [unclassified Sphingomonas]KQX22700.1 hypothetical protein ASD17_05275 [Sphingomonas sp. Root1294]KQY67820.1 hypothetical protein ASD39_07850 [Sphingomonas sp. Root50]KRB88744.1 hypothetical protein ASE22_20200 [Sphingomonas sp. Root720]
MFSFVYDNNAHILRISVEGLWAPEDVPALAAALGSAARRASAIRDDFDVIVESLDFPLQADDVADALSDIMRVGMALTTGHAAVVVGSLANREQAERTLAHPHLRVFMSMEEAQRWLAEAGAARRGAGVR